jgi:Spy/CpxP family protein refolding chaperone
MGRKHKLMTMKRKLIALTAASALALGTLAVIYAQNPATASAANHQMGDHRWGNPLDRLDHQLQLTADQKAKVQPIIDQTKMQLQSIRETAHQQSRAALQNAVAQVRPLLIAAQQQRLDAIQKACADLEAAHQEMRAALQQ